MTGATRVVVIGSGRRVREAALPAFARMAGRLDVARVFAKHAKTIEAAGAEHAVEAFETFGPADLEGVGLVYAAVSKDVVPRVLERLVAAGADGRVDLLIDTPVVRFKHYRHARLLERFRNAWVSEDTVALPWFDALRAFLDARGARLERVAFHRSAYAYHGVAMAKELLGCRRVTRGRRRRLARGEALRTLSFANGTSAEMHEPRDYAKGRVVLATTAGVVSERPGEGDFLLEPVRGADGHWTGFRIGDVESALDEDEVRLLRGDAPPPDVDATITSRMDDLKRVGFLRLLRDVAAGRGTYPATEAIDDTVVDYHLEKLGLWIANPFTSPRYALGRFLLRTLTRAGG